MSTRPGDWIERCQSFLCVASQDWDQSFRQIFTDPSSASRRRMNVVVEIVVFKSELRRKIDELALSRAFLAERSGGVVDQAERHRITGKIRVTNPNVAALPP